MVLRSTPVPMPEKKITFKTASNGSIYAYYTLRAYRNRAGNPTSDEVSIGEKDPITGMLIPNRRYFELFDSSPNPAESKPPDVKRDLILPTRVASYGNAYSLLELAESLGLRSILEQCFPEKWRQMLITSLYMLCEGNIMMYIDDWFDETDVPLPGRIDDHQCSRLFASISYDERVYFFKEWIKLRSEIEYIAYDVTSVSIYSKGLDSAEWGYNRDNDQLPQVNLGMFYGSESCLPVYYDMYNGSIVDKSQLICTITAAEQLGISNARFVLDRGFVTEDNLTYMDKNGHFFVTALPGHLVDAKKIIDSCKDSIRKSANRISEFNVYALPVDIDIYGFQMKAHVYFDTNKQATDEKELYARIERLQADLEGIGKKKRVTKKYTDFFVVQQEKAEQFSFTRDNDKIDEKLSRTGFFILMSNDSNMNSQDVLRIYRRRGVIEENFDQLKNDLDFRRLRTHMNRTTDGKVFVGFIALIIRSHMLNMIKNATETKQFTMKKILMELRKIKSITFEDSRRIVMPLTKLQRVILECIGVPHQKLLDSLG
jgi:transposase